MPISTRSKSSMKPVSTWNATEQDLRSTVAAAETLITIRRSLRTPAQVTPTRPHRSSANYTPGTFTGMEE
jgi:hypothetical protein